MIIIVIMNMTIMIIVILIIITIMIELSWVTEFSGKALCREMRGFAGREKQPQSGASGTANQQPAS